MPREGDLDAAGLAAVPGGARCCDRLAFGDGVYVRRTPQLGRRPRSLAPRAWAVIGAAAFWHRRRAIGALPETWV